MLSSIGDVAILQYELMSASASLGLQPCEGAAESTIAFLVHKLRQPLSVIETSAYYLSLILPAADTKARAQLGTVRRQVEYATRVLDRAAQAFEKRSAAAPAHTEEPEETRSLTNAVSAGVM